MIYETKSLSLEQIDELFDSFSKAWRSQSFKPTISFRDVVEVKADQMNSSVDMITGKVSDGKFVDHVER